MTARCTCCTPHSPEGGIDRRGRLVTWDKDAEVWVHLDDETEASMLHVHIDSTGRDCDGQLDQSSVTRPVHLSGIDRDLLAIGERWWEHVETSDFWSRMVSIQVYPYADDGPAEMSISRDDDGMYTFTQARPTEEGYHSSTARLCKDEDCAYESSSQRDHTAEAAGY